jgi:two-component system, OmpR family, response regulator
MVSRRSGTRRYDAAWMRILVIEDDAAIASAVARGLRAEGYTVEIAADGDDGIWMAREGGYDAIILDLMLPGQDGFAVCATLRGEGDRTPILMLTARDSEHDLTRGLDTGADDYLTKPFSFAVLGARIRALCRRSAGREWAPVRAGDLTIDPPARKVWRGDIELPLTTRQFDVLEFLMRRAGRVVSRDDILLGVWGFEFEGDPNIVDVYVRRLRTRIDEPFSRHAIETVRGAGYRLAPDGG